MEAPFRSPQAMDAHQSLTAAQLAAVEHVDGPLLILAGPGSGKTRVVTHRIAHLLAEGVSPRQILALTFTNKAAAEMRSRVEKLAPRQPVWMGTFHGFCARLLRQNAPLVGLSENYSIYDMDDSHKLLVAAIEDERVDLSHVSPDAIGHAISWAKNNLITPDKYTGSKGRQLGGIVERVYPAYQRRLLRANAVDFDDLLMHVATLLRENPEVRAKLDERYRYILVDEYQDTNLAQYAIVRALSIDHPNLAVTGDPDQSIYGWRGANLSNILEFERDFPSVKVVRLEQNYRSTKAILRVADQLICHNVRRKKKQLFTDNAEGAAVRLNCYPTQRDEADDIAAQIAKAVHSGQRRPRDFAVFYRINALSRQIEHALREHVIPYQIVNGVEFFQRKEIKDVLAYLHLVNNPRSDVALLRIINTPTRGIGKSTVVKLQDHARKQSLPLLDAAREAGLVEGLAKKSAVAVAKFVALFDRLGEVATAHVEAIVGRVLHESEYEEVLKNSEAEEDQERLANLQELLTAAREFDMRNPGQGHLEQFLEETSLVADTDAWESESDKVTLMTMHAAKGLEFPVVFIIACEQGLLPHERSRNDEEKVEEERRLLFVGITRAEEELQLSHADYRMFRGMAAPAIPSPFLMELPRDEMQLSSSITSRPRVNDWEESQLPREEVEDLSDDEGDDSFDVDDFSQVEPEEPKKKKAALLVSGVTTAASLLAEHENGLRRVPPSTFKHGMTVEHREYGIGTIISLSGEGTKRRATVRFSADTGEKTFVLLHANLQPVE
jgi:DNA helicase II / ATP-dependent DNA helicase PcrA